MVSQIEDVKVPKYFCLKNPSDAERVLQYQINRCLADEDSVHLSSEIATLISAWGKMRKLGNSSERLEKLEAKMLEVQRLQKQKQKRGESK